MKYCCEIMSSHISNDHDMDQLIYYDKCCRTYAVRLIKDDHGTHQIIKYCPWCGTKLPEDLSDRWFEILNNEYDIDDPMGADEAEVPIEFLTDEWWKKRGM